MHLSKTDAELASWGGTRRYEVRQVSSHSAAMMQELKKSDMLMAHTSFVKQRHQLDKYSYLGLKIVRLRKNMVYLFWLDHMATTTLQMNNATGSVAVMDTHSVHGRTSQ